MTNEFTKFIWIKILAVNTIDMTYGCVIFNF